MLKEFIQELSRIVVAGDTPKPIGYDRTKDQILKLSSGGFEIVKREPADRHHMGYDFASLALFAAKNSGKASIWYSREGATCFADDSTRHDECMMAFDFSCPWDLIAEMNSKTVFTQRDLWNLLRTTLRSPAAVDLAKKIASIKFDAAESGSSEVARGKVSIGKSITSKMGGMEDIDETVRLPVAIYCDPAIDVIPDVQFFIDPDETNKNIRFFPLPGEIESALQLAEDRIRSSIVMALDAAGIDMGTTTDDGPGLSEIIPIYLGEP